jgi:hypothetical protein
LQAAEAEATQEGAEGAAQLSMALASLREAEAEAQALARRGVEAEAEAARLQLLLHTPPRPAPPCAAAVTVAMPAGVKRAAVEQAAEGRVAAEWVAAEAEAEAARLQAELLSAHHALLTQHKVQLQQRERAELWQARYREEKLGAADRKQRQRQEAARQDEEARARASTWRLAPAASEPRLSSAAEYVRLGGGGGARALSVGEFPDAVLPQAQRQLPRPMSAGHMRMRVDMPCVWTDLVARRDPSPAVTTSVPDDLRPSSSTARLTRG